MLRLHLILTQKFLIFLFLPSAKVMFLHLSLILFTRGVSIPECTTGHMARRISVRVVSVQGVSVLRSLSRGSLSKGVSVQGDLCLGVSVWEVSVQGGLCPGEVSVQGGLCPGGSLSGVSVRALLTVTSGRYASYWNAFLCIELVELVELGELN